MLKRTKIFKIGSYFGKLRAKIYCLIITLTEVKREKSIKSLKQKI